MAKYDLSAPMAPETFFRDILYPAFEMLPEKMNKPEAVVQLIAIAYQESNFQFRIQQPNGPAKGFWQFESGGGVKGWYREHFFRSLRELTFMLHLDREGRVWKTGETSDYVVRYVNPYTQKLGTYRPDFIVDTTRMVECKPISLQNTVIATVKAQAAREFCAQREMSYQIIDPGKITWQELFELERSAVVILTERTKKKLNENFNDSTRASGMW